MLQYKKMQVVKYFKSLDESEAFITRHEVSETVKFVVTKVDKGFSTSTAGDMWQQRNKKIIVVVLMRKKN